MAERHGIGNCEYRTVSLYGSLHFEFCRHTFENIKSLADKTRLRIFEAISGTGHMNSGEILSMRGVTPAGARENRARQESSVPPTRANRSVELPRNTQTLHRRVRMHRLLASSDLYKITATFCYLK
jgi:hypothetical protein